MISKWEGCELVNFHNGTLLAGIAVWDKVRGAAITHFPILAPNAQRQKRLDITFKSPA